MYKYLAILSFSFFSISAFAESDCLNQLKKTNVKNIVDTCFTFENGNINMATLFGTNFKHEFGSRDNPSIEAIYLKKLADNGDPQAQFVWGEFVLGLAYREITDLDILKESDKWVSKSAKNGYPLAMFSVINSFATSPILKSEEDKLEAIAYAELLIDNGYPQIKELLNKIKVINSKDKFAVNMDKLFQDYEKLNAQQILDLASIFIRGRYYFSQHKSLKLGNKDSKVSKDFEKSIFLLKHSIEAHKNPEAGYQLGRILEKQYSGKAFKYYLWAAENNHSKSAGWIGEFFACTGAREKGINWLNKARILGYEYAEDSLGEIEELGSPTNCELIWNSWI